VPNFFIEKFRIPPFLLPIYQARGMQYGVRWEVLRRDQRDRDGLRPQPQRVTAGALGLDAVHARHLEGYGVDGNRDGSKDPYNPGGRDLRGGALPARGGRREGPPARRVRVQPRGLVRGLRAHARPG
jgi:hypothetical protein